jgi:hypothetical protein
MGTDPENPLEPVPLVTRAVDSGSFHPEASTPDSYDHALGNKVREGTGWEAKKTKFTRRA